MLGYGAMELRGAPRGRPVDRQEAVAVLNAVLDGGVNFIDTSIDYGISEELIGEAIGHRRGEFYLASKCGCVVGAAPAPAGQRNPHVFTRENITAGVNQSLARMKTDYLDLVQFHASPSRETLEQHAALETLRDLQREGKIRFIGISGTLPNLPEQIAMDVFDAFQIPYSALQREHEGLISKAARSGGGTVIRGGVAKGIPTDGREPGDPWQLWEKAGLDDLLDGMTRMEFILRFTLSHPDLHTTIVGTKSMEHLQQNLAAARKGPLLSDVYEEAKRRLSAAGAVPEPTTT
jgi:aryl-alcohol dehydrogenase-like predicted oxidoreductase